VTGNSVLPMRRLLLAVAVLATLVLAAPAHALIIGIGDQKPDMFSDQRFLSSGIHYARRAVPWDVLTSPSQTAALDVWMEGARAANVEPLISFTHSSAHRRRLPTPERLLYEFRRLRARYPWAQDFAAWNEANHCGEPTCHRPALVAAYWRKLREGCPTCRILAAEVLDMPNMVSWVKAFRRHVQVEPRYWGLHNYIDANRLRTTGTRRLLGAVRGQVWFTETGGIVARTNRTRVTFPESVSHAAVATRWVFDKLVPMSRRVTRVYLYHWNSEPGKMTWDSALIGPNGRPRPAFRVLQKALRASAARAAERKRHQG
jgi:polysaccharide biosynthesis protein PslG